MSMQLERARALLSVGEQCSAEEVRRAFRRQVRELRPDLPGQVEGQVVVDLRQAREALLARTGQGRLCQLRSRATETAQPRPYRPSTWGLDDPHPCAVDVRL
jgi:hypothetical protein